MDFTQNGHSAKVAVSKFDKKADSNQTRKNCVPNLNYLIMKRKVHHQMEALLFLVIRRELQHHRVSDKSR